MGLKYNLVPILHSSEEHYHIFRGAGANRSDSSYVAQVARYSANLNLNTKVLVNQLTRTQAEGNRAQENHRRWV